MLARVSLASVLSVSAAFAVPDEGIRLNATRQGAQDVHLEWAGGGPTYHVYRSTNPSDVTAAGNELGQTSVEVWLDNPPAGTLYFYRVLGVMAACTSDLQCAPDEYCGASAVCLPDRDDGMTCAGDSYCFSAHCANGYCCASGDCCASSTNCGAYGQPLACDVPVTCQGTRIYDVCASSMCSSATLGDDSACTAAVQSGGCGPYPSVFCNGAMVQSPPACPASCAADSGCDANAHCDASTCLLDLALGASCDEDSDCITGSCADGVCCSSACSGTCSACNQAGSVGTCTAIPDGTDPSAECGGVSCSTFYWGWTGDTCYRKADVGAAQAFCGGDNACRTQSEECTAATTQGSATVTCNAQCQDPNLLTCMGTSAGICANVNPGNQSCGNGPCSVTVPVCNAGAPMACVPNSGASSPETCNYIDDNCDGTVDNGAFQDALEPNNTCAQVATLAGVGSDQTQTTNPTLYPSGDVDYYRFVATETDNSCGCGSFSVDEDYQLTTTLTVPSGAGSYEVCVGPTCDGWFSCKTVSAGTTDSIVVNLDGACGVVGNPDTYTIYLKIRGVAGAGFACHPYSLSYFFDAGYCF